MTRVILICALATSACSASTEDEPLAFDEKRDRQANNDPAAIYAEDLAAIFGSGVSAEATCQCRYELLSLHGATNLLSAVNKKIRDQGWFTCDDDNDGDGDCSVDEAALKPTAQ